MFGAGFFLGFFVIVAGRIMDRIEMTRIRMGGNPRRRGGRVLLAGATLWGVSGAVLFLMAYVLKIHP